jgi:hypothetical protein
MASFAVLRHQKGDHFEIKHCHLNLWRLPGFLRERVFFDVGLHIAAGSRLTTFKVVLPFSTEAIRDLRQALNDKETAALIFRRASAPNTVSFRNANNVPLIPITIDKCHRRLRDVPDHSVWEIEIDPLASGTEGYVRFRFTVQNDVPTWNVKRHLLLAYGAVMDFRIADTREARRQYAGQIQWDYAVDIGEVNLFLVAPSELQMQNTSPAVYVSRLLEGDAWRAYLGRRTKSRRLSIFGWEYPAAVQPGAAMQGAAPAPINQANPYRVFLDLTRDFIGLSLGAAIQNTIAILILFGAFAALVWWILSASSVAPLRENLQKTGVIGAGVIVVGWIAHQFGWLRKAYELIARIADWMDKKLYGAS